MAFCFPKDPPLLQQQEKKNQKIWRNVRDFVQNDLDVPLQNTSFLLAVSGGADSLALLCLWQWFASVEKFSFSVLHINHGLRPESKDEAHAMHALCKAWNIPCFIEEIDTYHLATQKKMGIEETARKQRYALLEHYRKHCQATWICLGHHIQDVQEDILMRLIRGAGWPALGGMTAKDAKRRILRPLLLQQPHTLRTLLTSAGLTWAEDASNADTQFLRNRVRHTLLPLFHAENPSFSQKAEELWQLAQYDAAHWQNVMDTICTENALVCHEQKVTLPAKLLKNLDTATRLRLYIHAVNLLKNTAKEQEPLGQIRAHTLFQLDKAFKDGRGNTLFQLPGKITAYLKNNTIIFQN